MTPVASPSAAATDGERRGADTGQPVDQPARRRIREALDRTIFATAGAGSGKTTHLVERVCALVTQGHSRIEHLAVITFTEAAAAELRDRVAEALEVVAKRTADGPAAQRAADALAALDGAAITTLHGFARRILATHPFEARLPATFEVLDEAQSLADLDEQWHGAVAALLDEEHTARAVQWLVVLGVDLTSLRTVLRQLGENWDRVARSDGDATRQLPRVDGSAVLGPLQRAIDLSACCTDGEDSLLGHLESLRTVVDELEEAGDDELGVLRVLSASTRSLSVGNRGKAKAWGGTKPEITELLASAQAARHASVCAAADAALRAVVEALAELTIAAAARRRHDGRLHYHDLLVLACALVRDHRDVRAAVHDEFRVMLVDEFQDTDPLQAELVTMIACDPAVDVGEVSWWELPIPPGALFFVGDPLQSIYGFRRADIATFMRVNTELAQETAALVTNFRSASGIVDWVNAVFATLVGDGVPTLQPRYEPAVAARRDRAPRCPVTVLGADAGEAPSAEQARARETAELADLLRRAVDEGWRVGRDGRPVEPDDIAVLVPSRRSVPALEAALDAVELPFRLESSSLVYGAAEVEELLHVLRAVDDPSDAAAVVAALRTPGFGCGDDDLVRFRLAGGTWDYRTLEGSADEGDDPVRRGLAVLGAFHDARAWMGVSELVARVLEDRRQFAAALDDRHWREEWRRLRFVADQARQFSESSSGGLREYLAWVDIQREEDARVTEVVLPEADAPAVAVMTVHAAKGLEFPVVAVVGLGVAPQGVRCPTVLFGPAGLEVGMKATRWTAGFEAARTSQDLVHEHERLRLLYVAVTRAQHHLVVSVHRAARGAQRSTAARLETALDAARGLWSAPDAPGQQPPIARPSRARGHGATELGGDGPDALDQWALARAQRLASPRRVVAATSVASLASLGSSEGVPAHAALAAHEPPHADEPHADEPHADEPHETQSGPATPAAAALWRRGRGGTAVGRAVHAVLQTVDLATGAHLMSLALAHATREGVPERAPEIAELARAALESDVVRHAVAGRYWRELYVGVPVGARVLEGFVDLVYEGPGGLEVVDYKTDRIDGDAGIDELVERYRLQGAAYAYAVGAITGRDVAKCTFLFLRGAVAVAGSIPDLATATHDVLRLLGAQLPLGRKS